MLIDWLIIVLASQSAQQIAELTLLIGRKDAHFVCYFGPWPGKMAAIRSCPALVGCTLIQRRSFQVAFTGDETAFAQVVDDERHIAATLENFAAELVLVHRSKVVERLQYAKLTDGQIVVAKMAIDAFRTYRCRSSLMGHQRAFFVLFVCRCNESS